jgi:hypothetical protein
MSGAVHVLRMLDIEQRNKIRREMESASTKAAHAAVKEKRAQLFSACVVAQQQPSAKNRDVVDALFVELNEELARLEVCKKHDEEAIEIAFYGKKPGAKLSRESWSWVSVAASVIVLGAALFGLFFWLGMSTK